MLTTQELRTPSLHCVCAVCFHWWSHKGLECFAHVQPGRQRSSKGSSFRWQSQDYSDSLLSPAGLPGTLMTSHTMTLTCPVPLKPIQPHWSLRARSAPCRLWLPCLMLHSTSLSTGHFGSSIVLPPWHLHDYIQSDVQWFLLSSFVRVDTPKGFHYVTQSLYFLKV